MDERLAARRDTVMAARRDALMDSPEYLAGELELMGSRLDVEMLRKAATAYRQARQAIMMAQHNETDLLRLFHALSDSTTEIGTLLHDYGVKLRALQADPDAAPVAPEAPRRD